MFALEGSHSIYELKNVHKDGTAKSLHQLQFRFLLIKLHRRIPPGYDSPLLASLSFIIFTMNTRGLLIELETGLESELTRYADTQPINKPEVFMQHLLSAEESQRVCGRRRMRDTLLLDGC